MGYKYKGNLAYGKNGTSYRGRGNTQLRFGAPGLHESQDFFSKDSDRRTHNPAAFQTDGKQFNVNRTGWIEERAPSTVPSRKAAQSQLTYDNVTLPRIIINDKQDFDTMLAEGKLDNTNIPLNYRKLKYPVDFSEIHPYNYQSSLIFRQENKGLIKSGFNNQATGNVNDTGFYIGDTFQWGIPAVIEPSLVLTSLIRFTHRVYALGGFENSFTNEWCNGCFVVRPKGPFKYHPVNYNNISPKGSMLSNQIGQYIIKGEKRETLFSGYRESRVSGSLGL